MSIYLKKLGRSAKKTINLILAQMFLWIPLQSRPRCQAKIYWQVWASAHPSAQETNLFFSPLKKLLSILAIFLPCFWKTGVFSSNRLLVLDFLTRGRVGGLSSFPNSFLWPVLFWPECGFDMFCSNYFFFKGAQVGGRTWYLFDVFVNFLSQAAP